MIITSNVSQASVKIYINDILHLHFPRDRFLCMMSWQYENEEMFYIEINLVGAVITCDYDKKELWVGVLRELDKAR